MSREFVSTSDDIWNQGRVGFQLREMFKEPSRWEID